MLPVRSLKTALDDPKTPEFASWNSYQEFADRVRRKRRYVWEKEVSAFLETVRATLKNRKVPIPKDRILYRAQQGIRCEKFEDEEGEI